MKAIHIRPGTELPQPRANKDARAPRLSPAMVRGLADPVRVAAEQPWSRPVDLSTIALQAAIAELEATTQPAGAAHALWCLRLLEALRPGESREGLEFRATSWFLAAGHLPDDLWTHGTQALLRSLVVMPAPAELLAAVQPIWAERLRQLARARALLGSSLRWQRVVSRPAIHEPMHSVA